MKNTNDAITRARRLAMHEAIVALIEANRTELVKHAEKLLPAIIEKLAQASSKEANEQLSFDFTKIIPD